MVSLFSDNLAFVLYSILLAVFASASIGLMLAYATGALAKKNFAFGIFSLLGFATFSLHTEYFWNILQISQIREVGASYALENKLSVEVARIPKTSAALDCLQDVSLPSGRGALTVLLVEHQGSLFVSLLRNANCPQTEKTLFEVKRFQDLSNREKEAVVTQDNLINTSFFALIGLAILGIVISEYTLQRKRT